MCAWLTPTRKLANRKREEFAVTAAMHTTRRALLTALPMLGLTAASTAAPLPGLPAGDTALPDLAAAFGKARAARQAVVRRRPRHCVRRRYRDVLDVVREIET